MFAEIFTAQIKSYFISAMRVNMKKMGAVHVELIGINLAIYQFESYLFLLNDY